MRRQKADEDPDLAGPVHVDIAEFAILFAPMSRFSYAIYAESDRNVIAEGSCDGTRYLDYGADERVDGKHVLTTTGALPWRYNPDFIQVHVDPHDPELFEEPVLGI